MRVSLILGLNASLLGTTGVRYILGITGVRYILIYTLQATTESVFSILTHKRLDNSTTNEYKVEKQANIHRIDLAEYGALNIQVRFMEQSMGVIYKSRYCIGPFCYFYFCWFLFITFHLCSRHVSDILHGRDDKRTPQCDDRSELSPK